LHGRAGGEAAAARRGHTQVAESAEPRRAQAGLKVLRLDIAEWQARYRAVEREVVADAVLGLGAEAQRPVVDVRLAQRLGELIEAGEGCRRHLAAVRVKIGR